MKTLYKIIVLWIFAQIFVTDLLAQPDFDYYDRTIIANTFACNTTVAMRISKYSISCPGNVNAGAVVRVDRMNVPNTCDYTTDLLKIELTGPSGYYKVFSYLQADISTFGPCIFDNSLPAGDYTLTATYVRAFPGGSITFPPNTTTFRIENRCAGISAPATCSKVDENCSPGNDGNIGISYSQSPVVSPNQYTIDLIKVGTPSTTINSVNAGSPYTFANLPTGNYKIVVTDAYGNTASCTATIGLINNTSINPADINLPPYVCLSTPPISLINSATTGGFFSGPGVTSNIFYPKLAGGAGVKDITYTNSGRSGCGSINVKTKILVQPNPRYIDRVISATATPMNDQWPSDFSDISNSSVTEILGKTHVFNSGTKGIWRNEESHVYIEDRKQRRPVVNGTNPNVDIRLDGIYDTLPLFMYSVGDMAGCFPRWRKTNTITKYNPYSNETENKDVLSRYSSALYGYKGDLATAVAVNSAETEIAFNGFDEFTAGDQLIPENMSPSNLTLFTQTSISLNDQFFEEIIVKVAMDNILTLEASAAKISALQGKTVKVYGAKMDQYNEKQSIVGSFNITSVDPSKKTITLDPTAFVDLNGSFKNAKIWKGKISFNNSSSIKRDYSAATLAVVNSSTYPLSKFKSAHTGKNSLSVNGNFESELYKLKVNADRNYVVSAWVLSSNVNDTLTYKSPSGSTQVRGIKMKFYDINGNALTPVSESATIEPSGIIIEGWQKLEGTIDPPTGTVRVSLVLNDGGATTLFDDIRVFPETGNIQTYVYNKDNYKVSAVLDNNNYATFYYYDEQGNLFLLKKETERGIKTIQESFSHQPERP